MTNFCLYFLIKKGSKNFIFWELEVEGQEKNDVGKKQIIFLNYSKIREDDNKCTFAPHLLHHECIGTLVGNFDISESEILKFYRRMSFVKKITILKCYQELSDFDPLLESVYNSTDEVKKFEINPEHTIQNIDNLREIK